MLDDRHEREKKEYTEKAEQGWEERGKRRSWSDQETGK
jgi:hypothetical protein